MVRSPPAASSKPAFHTPMLLDWTDEKLGLLSQEQLLNLLGNLDHQRSIGRIRSDLAAPLEQRITALLNGRNLAKRSKAVDTAAASEKTSDQP
jgi:hypothetical protein